MYHREPWNYRLALHSGGWSTREGLDHVQTWRRTASSKEDLKQFHRTPHR